MPRLMEKTDWSRTISDFGNVERVWQEDVQGNDNVVSLSLPELGMYRVFLVKVDGKSQPEKPKRKSARDMLGYGARFHKLRTTEEWMRELREGENA